MAVRLIMACAHTVLRVFLMTFEICALSFEKLGRLLLRTKQEITIPRL